jgi:alpha-mannosidase
MEITLIRSGWSPNPQSGVGHHEFVYSILPHKGSWQDGCTNKEGYCLNNGIITGFITGNEDAVLSENASFVKMDNSNVAISAFKSAEAGDGIILRLYNCDYAETELKVELGFDVESVSEVDMNEIKAYESLVTDGRTFEFRLGGFEIKTFKLSSTVLVNK